MVAAVVAVAVAAAAWWFRTPLLATLGRGRCVAAPCPFAPALLLPARTDAEWTGRARRSALVTAPSTTPVAAEPEAQAVRVITWQPSEPFASRVRRPPTRTRTTA